MRGVYFSVDPRRVDGTWSGVIIGLQASPLTALRTIGEAGDSVRRQLRLGNNCVVGDFDLELPDGDATVPAHTRAQVRLSAPLFHDAPLTADLLGADAARNGSALASLAYTRAEREADVLVAAR